MKESTVLVIAPQRWDFEIGSNARNISIEFAKNNRVIYVDPPLDWNTLISNWLKKGKPQKLQPVDRIAERLWRLSPNISLASINWLPNGLIYRVLNKWNNKRFATCIFKYLGELKVEDFVVFNDNYIFNGLHLKDILKPKLYIYYIRDFLTIQSYFSKHGPKIEQQLIQKSDAVVANSLYLKEYAEQFNKKSFDVGQGCEVDMFKEEYVEKIPQDLKNIASPIIGYMGFLTSMRLDIELLIEIAEHNKRWSLVLVGPEDNDFRDSRLHQISNVHFLGKRDPAELPSYVMRFDVCINPQAINPLTIGNYPRKIDEYLAMGKPTVAMATKGMTLFKNYTYLAEDNSEFIKHIESALDEKDAELKAKRIAFARSHTWENSVNEIYKVIDQLNYS